MLSSKTKPLYIDLFSGCGGLSLGLYKAGWKGVFAIEKSAMAFMTLEHNLIKRKRHFLWPSWLPVKNHNINSLLKKYASELRKLRGSIRLVAGGPPCQGFSFAGRRKEKDSRNKLAHSYIKFIELVKPEMIFFENVLGFTVGFQREKTRGKAYSTLVEKKLQKLGYKVKAKVVDFADYGIPQRRNRFILVGVKKGSPEIFFQKLIDKKFGFLKEKGLRSKMALKDAISDLKKKNGVTESIDFKGFVEGTYASPKTNFQRKMREGYQSKSPDSHRFPNHSNDTIKKFKYILKNCKRNKTVSSDVKTMFKLKKWNIIPLDPKTISPTLTTLPDDYVHYDEPRILTVREYARIQSFDDWFEFKGKYTTGGVLRKKDVPRYTQIGNAVPPLFAELSGRVLKEVGK